MFKKIDVKTKSEEIQEEKPRVMHKKEPQGKDGQPSQCSSAWGSWNLASGKGAAGVSMLMWLFWRSRLLGNFSLKLNDSHVFCNECTVLLL